jgi:hypothetical protein
MPFRITQLPSSDKLCHRLSWPIVEQFFPRQRIEQLTESCCGQITRARKLTLVLVVWVLICWHLYLRHSLGAVFLKLSSAERWLGEEELESLPTRFRRKRPEHHNLTFKHTSFADILLIYAVLATRAPTR